jgi:hypothetical protein
MDSTTYNHEAGGCAAKFHVNGGGLSVVGVPFGRSGRGSELIILRKLIPKFPLVESWFALLFALGPCDPIKT